MRSAVRAPTSVDVGASRVPWQGLAVERFEGRTAAVTGAGSGIGRAIAVALAGRGCRLALADVDADGLAATADLLPATAHASTHRVDVSDPDAVDRFAAEVGERHGGCEILVNNAGVAIAGTFADTDPADVRWIVDVNVMGVVHGVRSFLPLLRAADEAHIVNLSSMVAFVGLPGHSCYSLTKGAVRAFSEALRGEVAGDGIGVTCVLPGAIRTSIMASARGRQAERLAELTRSRLAPVAMRSPDLVARRVVSGIERDRRRVLVGPDARALDVAARLLPGRSTLIGRLNAALDR